MKKKIVLKFVLTNIRPQQKCFWSVFDFLLNDVNGEFPNFCSLPLISFLNVSTLI